MTRMLLGIAVAAGSFSLAPSAQASCYENTKVVYVKNCNDRYGSCFYGGGKIGNSPYFYHLGC